MRQPTIGIVDYGVGNLASVWHALHALQFRCRISSEPATLSASDLLLLPGVGAFPAAMAALHRTGLVDYLQSEARKGRPMIGICLGMQLLAESSTEQRPTPGLGLLPATVRALQAGAWHIGWNEIEPEREDPLFGREWPHSVYFNHSYVVDAQPQHRVFIARAGEPITAVVRKDNVVGIQFHPEKSQSTGRKMLYRVVKGLLRD